MSINGAHHFNEVILDSAFVPDDMVFGEIGDGWQQVTSELAFERSGPERFLSTFRLLAVCADRMASNAIARDPHLGRLVARITGLHQMSTAVAGAPERHEPADLPAAVVKVLGTTTEGDIAEFALVDMMAAVFGDCREKPPRWPNVTRSSTLCLSTGGSTGALLVQSVTAAIPAGVIL